MVRSLKQLPRVRCSARRSAGRVLRLVAAGLERDSGYWIWECVSWHEVIDERASRLLNESIRVLRLQGTQAEALAYLLAADCMPPHAGGTRDRRDMWAGRLRSLSRLLRRHG